MILDVPLLRTRKSGMSAHAAWRRPGHRRGRRVHAGDGRTCGGRRFQSQGQDGRRIAAAQSRLKTVAPRGPKANDSARVAFALMKHPGCPDPQQCFSPILSWGESRRIARYHDDFIGSNFGTGRRWTARRSHAPAAGGSAGGAHGQPGDTKCEDEVTKCEERPSLAA